MPGRISAPGLEGRGEIQMPPVSEGKETNAHQSHGQEECQVALLGQEPLPSSLLHTAQAGAGFARELGKEFWRRVIVLI